MDKEDSVLLGHIYDTAINIVNRLKDVFQEEFDSDEDLRYSLT